MKTRTWLMLAFALAFFWLVFSPIRVRAQQEPDDPNWRERGFERVRKFQDELEKLRNEMEENRREFERMQNDLERAIQKLSNRPSLNPKSRFLDIHDYGQVFRNPELT